MPYRKLGLGLCAVLGCGIGVAASAQQLNPEQIQQIEYVTSFVCTTVKEQKGSTSRDQLQADVNAKIGGVFGKIIPLEGGGGAQGLVSHETYEGLSRDATATALEGDRGCRERVFNTMFDRFNVRMAEAARGAAAAPTTTGSSAPATTLAATAPSATTATPATTAPSAPATALAATAPSATTATPATTAPSAPTNALAATAPSATTPATTAPSAPAANTPPVTTGTECVVNNPSGKPMNVRETPNGAKKDIISNRARVRPLRFASAADGKRWAYVSDVTGREIGWVFYPFLSCNGPGIR
jgi:hypothetical protein